MAKRGPKIRTAENAADGHPGVIRRNGLDAPSELDEVAETEYQRLLDVLSAKGSLDRVNLGVVAEAARIKSLLDHAHELVNILMDPKIVKMVGALTTHRRGLLRELGLTLQPSRSVARTTLGSERDDKQSAWTKRLKIS